jgi:hypothetical protein
MAPTSKKAAKKVAKVMHEFKGGMLHSGSKKGAVVKSRKQAIAIAMSEAGMKKSVKKAAPKGKAHSPKGEYKSVAAKKKHEAKESPRKKAIEKKMGRSS